MQKAKVYRNSDEIGLLQKDDAGLYLFQYTPYYLQSEDALSISVHFPLQEELFSSKILFPFFFNLLSDVLSVPKSCLMVEKSLHFLLTSKSFTKNVKRMQNVSLSLGYKINSL